MKKVKDGEQSQAVRRSRAKQKSTYSSVKLNCLWLRCVIVNVAKVLLHSWLHEAAMRFIVVKSLFFSKKKNEMRRLTVQEYKRFQHNKETNFEWKEKKEKKKWRKMWYLKERTNEIKKLHSMKFMLRFSYVFLILFHVLNDNSAKSILSALATIQLDEQNALPFNSNDCGVFLFSFHLNLNIFFLLLLLFLYFIYYILYILVFFSFRFIFIILLKYSMPQFSLVETIRLHEMISSCLIKSLI